MLYLARRRLNLSVAEWRKLSWWERQVYIEGFMDEELITVSSSSGVAEEEEGPTSSTGPIDATVADDSALRRNGLTVVDGG